MPIAGSGFRGTLEFWSDYITRCTLRNLASWGGVETQTAKLETDEMENEMKLVYALMTVLFGLMLAKKTPTFSPTDGDGGTRISWLKIPLDGDVNFGVVSLIFATVATIRDELGFAVPPRAKDTQWGLVVNLVEGHGLSFGELPVSGNRFLTLSPSLINDYLRIAIDDKWRLSGDDDTDIYTPKKSLKVEMFVQHVDSDGNRTRYIGGLND